MVKKNRDKMIISINKAYFSHNQPALMLLMYRGGYVKTYLDCGSCIFIHFVNQ